MTARADSCPAFSIGPFRPVRERPSRLSRGIPGSDGRTKLVGQDVPVPRSTRMYESDQVIGASGRISRVDFAVALIAKVENARFIQQRFSVVYCAAYLGKTRVRE